MDERTERDNRTLVDFWDRVFTMTEDELAEAKKCGPGSLTELAPSQKLFEAAKLLGGRRRVLDYGCGSAWAAIIAAKSGCPSVTAADPAPGAVKAARFTAELFGAGINCVCITNNWLRDQPPESFDGFICSNVLDVIPPETAEEIIRLSARAVTGDAEVIFGLNYYLSPEAAGEKGMELEGCRLYRDGVLRLVSRTDEEWAGLFAPYFEVERLEHFAWPGEENETRRLFFLRKRSL